MNGTNKQRIIEHEVLHSKNIPCFQRKVLTPFFKGSSKGFFLTRVMEALDRESLRAFLYGMDVGDCATIGGTIPRREEEMDLGFGLDRPW